MSARCKITTLLVVLMLVAISLVASSASAWEILASSYSQKSIHRYMPNGTALGVLAVGTAPNGPMDFGIGGPARDLYPSCQTGNWMGRYNGATGRYISNATLNLPHGVDFDASGRLYVSHRDTSSDAAKVTRYSDPTDWGSASTLVAAGNNGIWDPGDLDVGPDGRVYVMAKDANNSMAWTIYVYDQSGNFVCKKATGTQYGYGLAFKPVDDGYLYFSDYSGNTIRRISYSDLPNGSFSTFASGNLSTAMGIDFGPDGDLYVASYGNSKIVKFNGSTGSYISDFSCVSGPRYVHFSPSNNSIVVGPGTRAFCTKIYGALGFDQSDADQLADSGFTLAIDETDLSDPIDNSGSQTTMQTTWGYYAGAGLNSATWQGLVAPYGYTTDGVYRLDRAGNPDSGPYQYMRPKSVSGWTVMGDAIMEWVNLGQTYTCYKLLCMDAEGAYGGSFNESYDDLTWSEYGMSTSIASSQRYNHLVSLGLVQNYIDWQYDAVKTQCQAQRARIDAVNPYFQIGIYGGGNLLDAVKDGFSTAKAPVVECNAGTYGRGVWNSEWDSDPEGGYAATKFCPDRYSLRWTSDMVGYYGECYQPSSYPMVYLAGHWAQTAGPDDGSGYKYVARQAYNSAVYGDGYWIWTDYDPPSPWTNRQAWIDAMTDYFALSNAAIDSGNQLWSGREVDAWYNAYASDPKTILSINGGTATKWNPITGVNEGTMSSSGYTAVTEATGDVDGVIGNETINLNDGWITIWSTDGSELLRFNVGNDQTGFALATLHSSVGGKVNSWECLMTAGGRVRRFDNAGTDWEVWAAKGPNMQTPRDLIRNSADTRIYVADESADAVFRYDQTNGNYLGKLTGLHCANGLAINSSGHLFVSHRDSGEANGMITKYTNPDDPSTASTFVSSGANGLYEPEDIGVAASNGNIYVLGRDSGNGLFTLFCYNSSGTFQWKRTDGLSTSLSMTFKYVGADEYIYISCYSLPAVKRVKVSEAQSGALTTFVGSGNGLSGAYGIAFVYDDLYVVSAASSPAKVKKYDSSGTYVSDYCTVTAPRYLTFSSVIADTHEAVNVGTAAGASDGKLVAVKGTVTSTTADGFWISGQGSSIKVLSTMTVSANDSVTVQGYVTTVSGSKVIKATFVRRPTVAT